MGEVYRAHDSKLKRDVAIKILPEDVASDPERLNRFQREAEVLASLNHAHIAHVYGIEDRALVMELVEGEDLSQRISRGPMSVDEALPIAKQIVEALEAAHNASIVHRDLKPGNIKVRDDGTVKVLDFGLAKALDPVTATRDLANSPTITSPAMTQRGVILGTAAYMSPEQARGGAVDARTDIWAVGCVVYEMLTGKRAFDGSGSATEPDWQALPAGVPASIRTLLRRCIEKDPRKRAPHIAIARLAIEDAMTPVPEALNRTARQSWLHGMVPIAITAFFAAVLGLAAWVPFARFLSATAAPVRIHFLVEPPGTAAFVPRGVLFMSVAPHGRSMVFQADSPSGRHLWLHSFVDGTARPLPETYATTQFWSPDG